MCVVKPGFFHQIGFCTEKKVYFLFLFSALVSLACCGRTSPQWLKVNAGGESAAAEEEWQRLTQAGNSYRLDAHTGLNSFSLCKGVKRGHSVDKKICTIGGIVPPET